MKFPRKSRIEQIADAYEVAAILGHFMVGVTEQVSEDELTLAEAILVERLGATKAGRLHNYREDAIDLVQIAQHNLMVGTSRSRC